MSRLAFLDKEGDLFPAAWRASQEGHAVRYWLEERDPKVQKIGVGLVPRAATLDDVLTFKPDVAVAYQTPAAGNRLRRAGTLVWGATDDSCALEEDRLAAARLAEKYGLTVPQTERFGSLAAARRFAQAHEGQRWVMKAEGGADVETSTTHPTDSTEQLLTLLDYEASRGMTEFILQARVAGVEVSTEGWFDHRVGWLRPINSTLERKRVHAGDLGPMCGCAGSIVWYWPDESPKLFEQVLEPLTPYLEEIKYVGPLDVNAILPYDGEHVPHFLEFTPRLGWSAFNALMAGITGDLGSFFVALGHGEASRLPEFRHPIMGSVRVSIPEATDVPVIAPYHAVRHLQPSYLWHDGKRLRTTGAGAESGYVAIFEATDADSTVGAVMDDIYHREIPRIAAPDNLTYRRDIGDRAMMDMMTLESWGYRIHPSETLVEPADQRPAVAPTRAARSV